MQRITTKLVKRRQADLDELEVYVAGLEVGNAEHSIDGNLCEFVMASVDTINLLAIVEN